MKKIIASILCVSYLSAAPYMGFKVGASKINPNVKLAGRDLHNINNNATPALFTYNVQGLNFSTLELGLLAGYSFVLNSKVNLFLEADYEFSNKSKSKSHIIVDVNSVALANEFVSIRKKHSVGFMPGFEFNITEKASLLAGVRLNLTQYEARAYHTQLAGNVLAENDKKGKSFVLGIEPTLGARVKFNEKISARFTVGYSMSGSKKLITNYMNSDAARTRNVTSSVTIKPRAWNVRAAMIYSF